MKSIQPLMPLFVFLIVISVALGAYQHSLCTNIDSSAHMNLVRYYAFQPIIDINRYCQNFATENRPTFNASEINYVTTVHKGIAMFALLFHVDAVQILVSVCILSLLYSVLISCSLCGRWWPLNLIFLVLSPAPFYHILMNGWVIQNIVTMLGLGMFYFILKTKPRWYMTAILIAEGIVLVMVLHTPNYFWVVTTSSLDAYRSVFSAQFLFMPSCVALGRIVTWIKRIEEWT